MRTLGVATRRSAGKYAWSPTIQGTSACVGSISNGPTPMDDTTPHSSSWTRPAPPILSPNAILVVTTDLEIVYAWVRAWTRCKNYAVQTMTEAEILARNNPTASGVSLSRPCAHVPAKIETLPATAAPAETNDALVREGVLVGSWYLGCAGADVFLRRREQRGAVRTVLQCI